MCIETQTILLVEDNAAVRTLLTAVLTRAGYRMITATDSDDAISQAAAEGGPIHLVITDVMMPGGTGAQLAAALSAGGRHTPVLFISGYAPPLLIRQGHLHDDSHFLQKPFTRAELLAKVGQLLGVAPVLSDRQSAA